MTKVSHFIDFFPLQFDNTHWIPFYIFIKIYIYIFCYDNNSEHPARHIFHSIRFVCCWNVNLHTEQEFIVEEEEGSSFEEEWKIERINEHIYLETTTSASSYSIQSITKDSYYIVKIVFNVDGNHRVLYF